MHAIEGFWRAEGVQLGRRLVQRCTARGARQDNARVIDTVT
jgi:hypothetical protein